MVYGGPVECKPLEFVCFWGGGWHKFKLNVPFLITYFCYCSICIFSLLCGAFLKPKLPPFTSCKPTELGNKCDSIWTLFLCCPVINNKINKYILGLLGYSHIDTIHTCLYSFQLSQYCIYYCFQSKLRDINDVYGRSIEGYCICNQTVIITKLIRL